MKIISIIIAFCIILVIGACATNTATHNSLRIDQANLLDVIPICEDGIICYKYSGGYAGGLSCIPFEDLILEAINKYCE